MGSRICWGALLVLVSAAMGAAQELVFGDGFELGHPCRWAAQQPAQDCSGAEIVVTLPGGVTLEMVRIPAGTFLMGSPEDERGRLGREELHQVTLTQSYYIAKTELTQGQWQAVMGSNPAVGYGEGANYPVYDVSWFNVAGTGGFIDTLNTALGTSSFRLPTEAEWERAARASTQTRFAHGDVLECDDGCGACTPHDQNMVWCGNDNGQTEQVASKAPNGYGLHDMHGNVLEWVQDWYQVLLGTDPVVDPTGPELGESRVLRSGHWIYDAQYCRSAYRTSSAPTTANSNFGFRLARSE